MALSGSPSVEVEKDVYVLLVNELGNIQCVSARWYLVKLVTVGLDIFPPNTVIVFSEAYTHNLEQVSVMKAKQRVQQVRQRVVGEVERHVPDPNFKKGVERVANLHQLVTKRLKTVYVFSLHLFKSFDFLVLSPFRRDKQLFIEGEIDHEQGEGVDAGQLSVLKLLDQYLL